MSEIDALKSLGPFVLVQAAFAAIILAGGIYAIFRGSWERKTSLGPTPLANGGSSMSTPQWMLYGPVHDTMMTIRDMKEQSRELNKMLTEMREMMGNTAKAQWQCVKLLESLERIMQEISNERRDQSQYLDSIDNAVRDIHSERRDQTQLLEAIRNQLEIRSDLPTATTRRRPL